MALYMIGIGLHDEKDISLRGLEAVKKCSHIYLESYTSILSCKKEDLETLYQKPIILADRTMVEQNAEQILNHAKESDTAFLVIGDVFGATTHTDLKLRAIEQNIPVHIIHNTSILTAVGDTGLELYKFGKTTSIPFENENVTTPIDVYTQNIKSGLHTLVLLDLRPDENKFMTIKEALQYLIQKGLHPETLCIGCAQLGSDNAQIKTAKASDLQNHNFTLFPQCLIIPGNLHFVEEDSINLYR